MMTLALCFLVFYNASKSHQENLSHNLEIETSCLHENQLNDSPGRVLATEKVHYQALS